MNGIENISKPGKKLSKGLLKWLGSLNWKNCLIIVVLIISLACIGVFAFSCSTVKTVSYGNGRVDTTVRQSVADSLNVNVSINPR